MGENPFELERDHALDPLEDVSPGGRLARRVVDALPHDVRAMNRRA